MIIVSEEELKILLDLFSQSLNDLIEKKIDFVFVSSDKYLIIRQYIEKDLVFLWSINDIKVYELGGFSLIERKMPPDVIITRGECIRALKFEDVAKCIWNLWGAWKQKSFLG